MKIAMIKSVLVALATFYLVACVPESEVDITSPSEGQVIIDEAFTINLNYPQGVTPSVTLNGRNLDSVMNYQTATASSASSNFSYALKQGANKIVVKRAGRADISREFTFDDRGPKVRFTSIERNDGNIELVGQASDASDIDYVEINGDAVTLNQAGEFTASVATAQAYGIKAQDANGLKSYDHYLAAGAELNPMIRSSVDQTLIDDIAPLIAEAMVVPKEESLFDVVNPLTEFNILGAEFKIDLKAFQAQVDEQGELVGSATVNSLVVSPQSSSGTVTADLTIHQPIIGVQIMIGDAPLRLNILADKLDINGANIRLSTDENQNFKVEFTEQLPIDLSGTRVQIANVGPLLEFLLQNPLTNLIVAFVTDNIEGIISEALPGIINAKLSETLGDFFLGLNIDDENTQFKFGISEFSKQGTKILADLTAQYRSKNPQLDDYALGVKTYATIDQNTGQISVGAPLPLPKNLGQLNAAVSLDFINQALLLAFEEALLDINLVDGELIIGEDNVDEMASEGATWIQIKPSVPELQLIGGADRANVDVNLDNFELIVRTRQDNQWTDALSLKVGINIFAAFGFNADSNTIFLETNDRAPIVDVRAIKILNLGIPAGLANGVVNLAVPTIADLLMQFFKIEIPVPTDLPLQVKDISTLGDGGQFLNLSFDIDLAAIIEGSGEVD